MSPEPTIHPLVLQLRFTRREFLRGIRGVTDDDGAIRLGPMNCIAWNVGHLAWQEQRYFITIGQERTPYPEVAAAYEYGAPGSTPRLRDTLAAWKAITAEADPWLDALTTELLAETPVRRGKPLATTFGNRIQRTIYHYWFHTGENLAIRQTLGHPRLPEFVGAIDTEAPYVPEPREVASISPRRPPG